MKYNQSIMWENNKSSDEICLVQNLAYHKVVVDKQISSWVVSYVMGQNG